MRVIGYTYEANHHCIDCTLQRYKSGGNPPDYQPLHNVDHWQELDESYLTKNPIQSLICGTCRTTIYLFQTSMMEDE
jgi:hypothetical protein